jgi:hypothetical protein
MSQSLIIARVGFSRMQAPSSAARVTALVFASEHQGMAAEEPSSSRLQIIKSGDDIEMYSTGSRTFA